jgi:hypothetical protein
MKEIENRKRKKRKEQKNIEKGLGEPFQPTARIGPWPSNARS